MSDINITGDTSDLNKSIAQSIAQLRELNKQLTSLKDVINAPTDGLKNMSTVLKSTESVTKSQADAFATLASATSATSRAVADLSKNLAQVSSNLSSTSGLKTRTSAVNDLTKSLKDASAAANKLSITNRGPGGQFQKLTDEQLAERRRVFAEQAALEAQRNQFGTRLPNGRIAPLTDAQRAAREQRDADARDAKREAIIVAARAADRRADQAALDLLNKNRDQANARIFNGVRATEQLIAKNQEYNRVLGQIAFSEKSLATLEQLRANAASKIPFGPNARAARPGFALSDQTNPNLFRFDVRGIAPQPEREGLLGNLGNAASLLAATVAARALTQSISFLKREIVDLTRETFDYNRQLLRTQTLAKGVVPDTSELAQQVANVASRFNQSGADVAAAQYEIFSQQLAKVNNGFDVLEQSAALARASGTSTAVAARALTSAMNAYGLSNVEAEKTAATLFNIVDLGSVSLNELGNSIGRVGTLATQAGFSLQDIGAAIAVLSNRGVRGEDANTQILNILNQIAQGSGELKKTFEELGFASVESGFKALGFANAIGVITDKAKGSITELKKLGSEIRGTRGLAGLSGTGAEAFASNVKEFNGDSVENFRSKQALLAKDNLEELSRTVNSASEGLRFFALEGGKSLANVFTPILIANIKATRKAIQELNGETTTDKISGLKDLLFIFSGNGGGVVQRAEADERRIAAIQAERDARAKVKADELSEEKKALAERIKIDQDRLSRLQRSNFEERDAAIAAQKQITEAIRNAVSTRINELEKQQRKQQELIDRAKDFQAAFIRIQLSTLDEQQATVNKEAVQDAGRVFRTPQELNAARAQTTSISDLTLNDKQLNDELNRRKQIDTRRQQIAAIKTDLEGQLNDPNLFSRDKGAIERANKLQKEIQKLAQDNVDEERDLRFKLDKDVFEARQALEKQTNKNLRGEDRDIIDALEAKLAAAVTKRREEEERINGVLKDRQEANKLDLNVNERIQSAAGDKIKGQEALDAEKTKLKNAQDAIGDITKFKVFDEKGQATFKDPQAAIAELQRLLAVVQQNTTDKVLIDQANQAAAGVRSQIGLQKDIQETDARQNQLADLSISIQKALNVEKLTEITNTLGQSLGNLNNVLGGILDDLRGKRASAENQRAFDSLEIDKLERARKADKFDQAQEDLDSLRRIRGYAEGAVSINSRDSMLAAVSPGESIINSSATQRHFNRLVSLNSGLDPYLPMGSTNFGDINVTLNGSSGNAQQVAEQLPAEIKKALRRQTWRNR